VGGDKKVLTNDQKGESCTRKNVEDVVLVVKRRADAAVISGNSWFAKRGEGSNGGIGAVVTFPGWRHSCHDGPHGDLL